jgi:hypothetical protein
VLGYTAINAGQIADGVRRLAQALSTLAKGRRATAPVWIAHERKPNSHPERPYGEV